MMEQTWVISVEFEGYTTGDVWVDLDDEEFETEDEVIQYVLDNVTIYADRQD
jgi:hypothetical protein